MEGSRAARVLTRRNKAGIIVGEFWPKSVTVFFCGMNSVSIKLGKLVFSADLTLSPDQIDSSPDRGARSRLRGSAARRPRFLFGCQRHTFDVDGPALFRMITNIYIKSLFQTCYPHRERERERNPSNGCVSKLPPLNFDVQSVSLCGIH